MTKEQFLEQFQISLASRFNGAQSWWTKSLFHFTDVTNALSIIENGKIYSRNKAIELEIMKNDNASDSVIFITNDESKNFTRLYFGPTTPTQKNNEGIQPINQISSNAHCPIPIMFIFDFKKVFLLEDVKFTDGNLANNPNIYDDVNDLNKLNFNLIYHRSWFYPEHRDEIINARHSEVLVKDSLSLENNLRLIIVRSEAEKEILLYQLTIELRLKYQNKIYVQPQTGIFTNDWLYINNVSITNEQLCIEFNICGQAILRKDKYNLKIVATNKKSMVVKTISAEEYYPVDGIQKINLVNELKYDPFELTIYLDDIKVYFNILGGV